jgi:hypothetical protein
MSPRTSLPDTRGSWGTEGTDAMVREHESLDRDVYPYGFGYWYEEQVQARYESADRELASCCRCGHCRDMDDYDAWRRAFPHLPWEG